MSHASDTITVVIVKPNKYGVDGYVERFHWGYMPNSTLLHLQALIPDKIQGRQVRVVLIDEYVHTDLKYLELLKAGKCSLLILAGVQSHQFHRALDLAVWARANGVPNCIIGGPHPMTSDTTLLQNHGVSFALAEAELIMPSILEDVLNGELKPVYGQNQRWQLEALNSKPIVPPALRDLKRYTSRMIGVYPARGCLFDCDFCSVIEIAGKVIRSESLDTTLASLWAAKKAGVRKITFTADNFNKWELVRDLLNAMIEQKINIKFFAQCDSQIVDDEELIKLMAQAGCETIFVGVESFSREILKAARKSHNRPSVYGELVRLCHKHGIMTFLSSIIGFESQDEAGVLEHLRSLRALQPTMASFYILTPFPGSKQYDDFLQRGLIEEKNLDRFDTRDLVWRHPKMSALQLRRLLLRCYQETYNFGDVARTAMDRWSSRGPQMVNGPILSYAAYVRFTMMCKRQPMTGGIASVKLDHVRDYMSLRKSTFGFEYAPLPQRLRPPEAPSIARSA